MSAARFITEKGHLSWQEVLSFVAQKKFWVMVGAFGGAAMGLIIVLSLPARFSTSSTVKVHDINERLEVGLPFISEQIHETLMNTEKAIVASSEYRNLLAQRILKSENANELILDNPFSKKGSLLRALGLAENIKPNADDLAGLTYALLKFEFDLNLKVIKINSTALNPVTAQSLAQNAAELLIEMRSEQLIKNLGKRREGILIRLGELKDELIKDEVGLAEIHSNSKAGLGSSGLAQEIERLERQKVNLKGEFNANQASLKTNQKKLTKINTFLKSSQLEAVGRMKADLEKLEYKELILSQSTEEDTKVQLTQIRNKIQAHKKWLAQFGEVIYENMNVTPYKLRDTKDDLDQKNNRLDSKMKSIDRRIASLRADLKKTPKAEAEKFLLHRRIELNSKLFTSLKTREQDLDLKLRTFKGALELMANAGLPQSPIKINIFTTFLFFGIAGGVFALIPLFFLAWVDDRIYNINELRSTGLEAFGSR